MAVATTVTVSSLCASPLRSPRTVPNFVFQFAPKFSSFKLGFESLQLRTTLPATKLVVRAARTESKGVSLGFRAPNFEIPEPLTGKVWKLEDFESHPALLVMFICNHCPFVKHLKKSIVKLANFYMKKGLAVVAISSNSVATHPQDGPQFMAEDAKLFKYPFPYLYDEAVEGVEKIRPGYNPATWMLDVTSTVEESRLGVDFAEVYRRSNLFQRNKELVENLSKPSANSKDLHFPSKYSQSFVEQFLTCLWKQNLSYWRNPQYTAVRFFYTVIISFMLGTICWKFGDKRETQQDLLNAMGSIHRTWPEILEQFAHPSSSYLKRMDGGHLNWCTMASLMIQDLVIVCL